MFKNSLKPFFYGVGTGVVLVLLATVYFVCNKKSEPIAEVIITPPKPVETVFEDLRPQVISNDNTTKPPVSRIDSGGAPLDSLWKYYKEQGSDTVELTINRFTGAIKSLRVRTLQPQRVETPAPRKNDEHSILPSIDLLPPLAPRPEFKNFSLRYQAMALRDLFSRYWKVAAQAELYLFGGIGAVTQLTYIYDGALEDKHNLRLLVGGVYHF